VIDTNPPWDLLRWRVPAENAPNATGPKKQRGSRHRQHIVNVLALVVILTLSSVALRCRSGTRSSAEVSTREGIALNVGGSAFCHGFDRLLLCGL
jgi:hypothetical protein